MPPIQAWLVLDTILEFPILYQPLIYLLQPMPLLSSSRDSREDSSSRDSSSIMHGPSSLVVETEDCYNV